jgi:FKBP-type peptidyl-prolyl cis-trans isomerase
MTMKNLSYILLFVATCLSACSLDNLNNSNSSSTTTTTSTVTAAQQAVIDNTAIKTYLTANNITAQKDSSGLYYQIVKQGTGVSPVASSNVTVTYVGSLLTGGVFDQSKTAVTFPLAQLIQGWQIGLPYLKAGGQIVLYIPSGLAYGTQATSTATSTVPANSNLIFTINLISVQ